MATKRLTKTTVESEPIGARDVYVWDSALSRFGLRVTPAAARIYLVQYRAKAAEGEPPKTRRITIGQHGQPWTVDQARDEARRILANVDLGRDPFADRRAERETRKAAEDAAAEAKRAAEARKRDTFQAVAERFIDLKAKRNRTWAETERLIRHDALPAWGSRHIAAIRRADVADLLDLISKRSPAVARSTYAALRGLFAWCVERDLISFSPCENLKAPPRSQARDRVLSDNELRAAWLAASEMGFPFGPVIQLLVLTGQRRAEVAGMRWSELDLARAVWRIPAERSKNGKAHEVDLSPQALAVIAHVTKSGPLLFPARGTGSVRGFSATKRKLDRLVEAARAAPELAEDRLDPALGWRLHDLRRTAATGMAALGFPPHVVERVLNHVSGTQSGLVGVYQRHEYRGERKAALNAWGTHLQALIEGTAPEESNVIAIRA